MKKLCILIIIFSIPLIMLAANQYLPTMTKFNTTPQFRDNLRSWRMAESLTDQWNPNDSDWQNIGKSVYFYNADHPTMPDSVVGYVFQNGNWEVNSATVYTYEPSHEYILETNIYVVITGMPRQAYIKGVLAYNNDHHLTESTMSFKNFGTEIWVERSRMHLIYNSQNLTSVFTCTPGDDTTPISYDKRTFDFDAQGRIITDHVQVSPDSVNWVNDEQVQRTYHASDTTTGASFLDILAHQYALNFMSGMEPYFGLQSEVLSQIWVNAAWVNNEKGTYVYDNNNHLTSLTYFDWVTGAWTNSGLVTFTYDGNGNYNLEVIANWNGTAWQNYTRISPTWEATTANDDNTVPVIKDLSLTAYPNPFKNQLNIQVNSKMQTPVSVQIFNLKGQLVYQGNTVPNQIIKIENKTLGNGIYFLKAIQGTDTCTRKIIQIR